MVRVVLCGMGAIGTEILRHLLERGHDVVAVIDPDPAKAGKTIAEVTGLPLGVRIQQSVQQAQFGDAEVAVYSARSRIGDVASEIGALLSSGLDVVTTSEEMAYPSHARADEAGRLDSLAREKGVTVVGVGVNPGFIMDWVPSVIASASKNPTRIHVVRSVDISRRRQQLVNKTGVGMTRSKFEKELEEGKLGHIGLAESAHLVALSLGEELKEVSQGVFPVMGSEDYVMGVRQFAEGKAGKCTIRLDLEMTTTSADFDVIEVAGDPAIKVRFEKGVFGDSATVAVAVHAVERVGRAPPGLITVLDLPLSVRRS
ncbi:MAG: NAD-binding protein [Nitrososphaerota archaeon]|nr:NAD-binding protein [Nitrososphaerota archaeon]